MQVLYNFFFKRILKLALFFQVIFTISFVLLQMPHFLYVIKGIQFNALSIVVILLLRSIEWFNFIMLITFISALLVIVSKDFSQGNVQVLFIQMGRPIYILIRPIMLLSALYGFCFLIMDGFLVPKAHFKFKQIFIEMSKDKLISNIQPKHIVPYRDWFFSTQNKLNETQLQGFLLHKENDPHITIFIKNIYFTNKKLMHMHLNDGIGKLTHQGNDIIIKFKEGNFVGPSSLVRAHKTSLDYILLELNTFNEIIKKMSMSFVALFVPFLVFDMVFGSKLYSICALISLSIMIGMAMNAMKFNIYIFICCSLIIYYIYRKLIKKMKVIK